MAHFAFFRASMPTLAPRCLVCGTTSVVLLERFCSSACMLAHPPFAWVARMSAWLRDSEHVRALASVMAANAPSTHRLAVCMLDATNANLWYTEAAVSSDRSPVFARDPDDLASAVRLSLVYGDLPAGGETKTFAHAATMLSSNLALHMSTSPLAISLFSLADDDDDDE